MAIDQFGQEAAVTLELQGVSHSSGTVDEANLADVTGAAQIERFGGLLDTAGVRATSVVTISPRNR